jgi:hypothetical protein
MNTWSDIKYQVARQKEIAARMTRIESRSAAAAEEAAKENNNKPKKIIWNDQDFQIALNVFTRYMYNKNDGEWNRWSRDVRGKQQKQEGVQ